MRDLEQAIRRIEFCINDPGQEEDDVIRDIKRLVAAAKEYIELKKQQQSMTDVLLSDEFHAKFAEAFANTPLPSMTVGVKQKTTQGTLAGCSVWTVNVTGRASTADQI